MSDDDLVSAFSRATDEEKVESFGQSTTALVLRQLGYPPAVVKSRQRDLGPSFGTDWFNDQELIPTELVAGRCFSFNLTDLLTKPTKCPVTDLWFQALNNAQMESVCLVFKCYQIGRLIATNIRLPEYSHLHVRVRGNAFNIVPFASFFGDRYGHVFQE